MIRHSRTIRNVCQAKTLDKRFLFCIITCCQAFLLDSEPTGRDECMAQEDLRKKVDLAFLSAFYGGLLTDKQRRVLTLHCEEDLSLGEIAAEVGISRQAVHETITRAAARLTGLEASLGVASRFRRMESGLENALAALKRKDYAGAEQLLDELLILDQEESYGL